MKEIAVVETEKALKPGEELFITRFLNSQDITKTSQRTYQRSLRQFQQWITETGTTSPSREDILTYKDYLQERGLSAFTVSNYLVAVRKLFEWAEGLKLYPNIAKGVKGARKPRGFMKDPLTLSQIKNMMGSLDRSTLQGKRDYALINLLVRTGLRLIEVSRANIEDMRQEGGEAVLWIQGKGRDSKDSFVLLTGETLTPITDYLRERGRTKDGEPLFASLSDRNKGQGLTPQAFNRIVKRTLRGVGIDSGRLTPHSLRHTAITLSLQAGATLQEAQALARHANINTTLIYAHNINRLAHAPERKIDNLLSDNGISSRT